MTKHKIAVIVGSNRQGSLNARLAQALAVLGADRLSFSFVRIDDLPLYNPDLEAELPASVARFKSELASADGVLVVTPEHNRSIPAVLKNAIDWGGRPYGQNSWAGKVAAIAGTSPGAIGAGMAQQHLRQILGSFLGVLVMGGEAYIAFRPGLVDDTGKVSDESTRNFLKGFVDQFASLLGRLSGTPERLSEAAA
ncbi:MAG TPA: NADPH-dependent FMN reductase [Xanthobacteraceae bacterium]|nr:NADPH-dependent FMN reductase [Xanthobacteraceae bacterium]